MSRYHHLSDDELIASFETGSRVLRACEPDGKARLFVITCPDEPAVVSDLVQSLNRMMPAGKSVKAYRQTQAGSIQIYLSFTALVSTEAVRAKLIEVFGDDDFVFHGADEPYVLPLQPGFTWLDEDLSPSLCRDELTLTDAARKFLNDLDESAIDSEPLDCLASPVIAAPVASAEVIFEVEEAPTAIEEVTSAPSAICDLEYQVDLNEQVLPENREALPSIPVDGGHQLLLFGLEPIPARTELPKEIPKRGRRGAALAAPAEDVCGVDVLKLFTVNAELGKVKRRSTKAST